MQNSPRVSIIIPVYNDERFIEDCLLSLKCQTFENFEVILIDDCSTDSTFEIVREKFQDDRIRVVRNEKNLMTAESRNRGLELARGEFIFFMDHDDMLATTALETLIDYAEKYRANVIHTSIFLYIDDDFHVTEEDLRSGNLNITHYARQEERSAPEMMTMNLQERLAENFANHKTHCTIWMNLYRRDFLQRFGLKFYDLIGEDIFFLFETLICAERFLSVPGGIYIWRKSASSISHRPGIKQFERILQSIDFVTRRMESYFQILDQIPTITRYNCLKFYMYSILTNYNMRELYGSDRDFELTDEILEKVLRPIFGDRTLLVKNLYHNSNLNLINLLEVDGV